MANPFYSDPSLEAYHKRNQTGLHGEAVGEVPRVGGSQDPSAVPENITAAGTAERAGLGQDVQSALVGSATSDIIQGKDPTRSVISGAGTALGTAAGTAVGGPIGGAIGGAIGGQAGNVILGAPESTAPVTGPLAKNPQGVPVEQGAPVASNPFFNMGTPMVHGYANGTSKATKKRKDLGFSAQGFETGESPTGKIASEIIMTGAGEILAIPAGALKYASKVGSKAKNFVKDINRLPDSGDGLTLTKVLNPADNYRTALKMHQSTGVPGARGMAAADTALTTGAGFAVPSALAAAMLPSRSAVEQTGSEGIRANPHAAFAYNHGTSSAGGPMSPDTFIDGEIASEHYPDIQRLNEGGTAGPAQGPMGTPDFGYVPSHTGPTREEIHADIKAAGIENREMMKLQAEEQRKTEIHHLKMADMAESAAIKQANLKKGPMAR